MPPRHGKSELISRFLPAWYLGTFPDRRVILTAHTHSLARHYGKLARDLLAEHGRGMFGVGLREDSHAADDWMIAGNDGGMMTAGIGGPITGRGANLLIVDDFLKNAEEAKSELIRENQWDWWQSTASTRLEPGGVAIVVATRWMEDDLSGRLIAAAASGEGTPVRRVRLPALAEDGDPLGRAPGDALWPERFSRGQLERMRADRNLGWWLAQYQQRPGRHEGTEWPESYFGEHIWIDDEQWPRRFELKALGVDPSKGKQRGDFSAIVFCGQFEGKGYVDASIERRPVETIVADCLAISRTMQPDVVNFETNGFQEEVAKTFEREKNRANMLRLAVLYTDNRKNKEYRIGLTLGQLLQRGLLRFRRTPGCKRLVQQLREFPLSEHDDGPDALEMAIKALGAAAQPEDAPGYAAEQVYA